MSRGYCYHGAQLRWKTPTLVRKWREGWGNAKQRASIAWELGNREPALALAEVLAIWRAPGQRRTKTLRRCLHHVADVATARSLFDERGFEPDALRLTPYLALVDGVMDAEASLDASTFEGRLERLGLFDAELPCPIGDGEDAYERYAEARERIFTRLYEVQTLRARRVGFVAALRETYRPSALWFVLDRWALDDGSAVDAMSVVSRLGVDDVRAELGDERLDALVDAFTVEIESLERPTEGIEAALRFGWLPGSAIELGASTAVRIADAFIRQKLDLGGVASLCAELDGDGPKKTLALRDWADERVVRKAAAKVSFAVAASLLPRRHPALVDHPEAPPDRQLLPEARDVLAGDPARAFRLLIEIAQRVDHPDRPEVMTLLHELARRPALRKHALHAFGEIGDPIATPVLLEALTDPVLQGSMMLVLTAVGRAADDRAARALADLCSDPHHGSAAAFALEAVRARPAV